jgi:hypothetical protein
LLLVLLLCCLRAVSTQPRTTSRGHLVVVVAPDHHQVGHAWSFDGTGFTQVSTTTIRLGSQQQYWSSHFDSQRRAIVAWSFEHKAGAVGCVIDGDDVRAVAPAGTKLFGEARTVIETTGAVQANADNPWDELKGLFAVDEARGVTVCLTRHALHELHDTTWTKVADVVVDLPNDVSGEVAHGSANGAGGVWDPVHQQVVFWFHDREAKGARFFALDGQRLVELARAGLPEKMWQRFGDSGFAVCGHEQHGVVVLVAGALYGRTRDGFAALPTCPGAPPACKVARMAHDPVRRLLVVGPHTTEDGEQQQWYVLDEAQQLWRTLGHGSVELPFQSVTAFAAHHGVAYAVDIYLRTWARRENRWVEVVSEAVADELRGAWSVGATTPRACSVCSRPSTTRSTSSPTMVAWRRLMAGSGSSAWRATRRWSFVFRRPPSTARASWCGARTRRPAA